MELLPPLSENSKAKVARVLIIQDGIIIPCEGSAPIENGVIVVEGERIRWIGPKSDVSEHLRTLPPDSSLDYIDASGKYVLPGLVNVHEHLDQHGVGGVTRERLAAPMEQLMVTAVRNAIITLARGVTTVRDLGAKGGSNIAIRDAIEHRQIVGPRVYASGQLISRTGGHGQGMCTEADGPEGVRRAVRLHMKQGADLIKLCASGGVVEAKRGENPLAEEYTQAELVAGVEEAHRAGLRVAVHAHPPAAVRAAIDAGVDSVEHGAYLDDDCAELLRDRSIYFVPTLDDAFTLANHGEDFARPDWMIENAKTSLNSRVAACERAIALGVKVAVGTDVIGEMSREMARLCQAGMSPKTALEAATRVGAEVLGVADDLGTLEAGKLADILLVDENPLANVSACQSALSLVIKGGVVYHPSELLGPVPAQWISERFELTEETC